MVVVVVVPLEGVAVDEQNELLSDSSSGRSVASGRRLGRSLLVSSRYHLGLDWLTTRRVARACMPRIALNRDDFYDLDPLTSSPAPIPSDLMRR